MLGFFFSFFSPFFAPHATSPTVFNEYEKTVFVSFFRLAFNHEKHFVIV